MDWLVNPDIWASFVTLAVLEVVLGIDNLVFIALLAGRLPAGQRARARSLGLSLALGTRLALLASIVWLVHLTDPIFVVAGNDFSWRDLILIGGGGFLLFKGTREIHLRVDGVEEGEPTGRAAPGFAGTVVQIMLLDIVFSLDSVITAVGIAEEIWVMVAAIIVAMAVMLAASGPLAAFIERHASVKMLALSFLLLIGMVLVADGFGFHVPRGYVYAAMGFSILVESLNLIAARRRAMRYQSHQIERIGRYIPRREAAMTPARSPTRRARDVRINPHFWEVAMSGEIFGDSKRALEEAFFARENEALRRRLREKWTKPNGQRRRYRQPPALPTMPCSKDLRGASHQQRDTGCTVSDPLGGGCLGGRQHRRQGAGRRLFARV